MIKPKLITFDIFGTVVDWRGGLRRDAGGLTDDEFDRIIDVQGREEQGKFRPYRAIVKLSLIEVLKMAPKKAEHIGANAGKWPLYDDSIEGLRRLMRVAACAATTNSDAVHGEQVQKHLGFRLSHWICSEDLGFYKPSPRVWEAAAKICGVEPGPDWWHVSAYADYDLGAANRLGLTTVFVPRPHARPGKASLTVENLIHLAEKIACLASK